MPMPSKRCGDTAPTVVTMTRTYTELRQLPTFEERFKYLRLGAQVAAETFGFDRWVNQRFYKSPEWRKVRRDVIIRDEGRDLGVEGYELQNGLYVHHMNPMIPKDIVDAADWILNPEYLICVSYNTHQAIHFGDESLLPKLPMERKPNDTCPWKN